MARIPAPAQRGQAVGSVQSQFTATPFQRLNPDADVFGASQGRLAAQVGKGATDIGAVITQGMEDDDNVELMKLQTSVDQFNLTQTARINALVGQEKVDAASTASTDWDEFRATLPIADIQLPAGTAAASDYLARADNKVNASIITWGAEGKRVVDAQVSTALLAVAGQNFAVDRNVTVFQSTIESVVSEQARQAGLDPTLLTYTGKDPEKLGQQRVLLQSIKEQESAGLTAVIDSLSARGDYAAAVKFLDDNPDLGKGTAGRTSAEAKVAPLRKIVESRTLWGNFFTGETAISATLGNPGGPTLAELRGKIVGVNLDGSPKYNASDRAMLLTEWGIYAAAETGLQSQKVRNQGAAVINALAAGTAVDAAALIATNPDYFAEYPEAALNLGGRIASVSAARVESTEDQLHVLNGGSLSNRVGGLEKQMSLMFQSDPVAAARIIDAGTLKKYFDRETYEQLEEQAETVKKVASQKDTGNKTNARTVMRSLGYDKKQTDAVMNTIGQTITAIISDIESAAKSAGRPVNSDDVRKAVVEQLISVQTYDAYVPGTDNLFAYIDPRSSDKYSLIGALTQAKVDAGFSPYDANLKPTRRNYNSIAWLFEATPAAIKVAEKELDDKGKEFTINNLSKHLNMASPPEQRQAAANMEAMESIALNAGYPVDFVEWVLDSVGKPRSVAEFNNIVLQLKGTPKKPGSINGFPTETMLQAWATK